MTATDELRAMLDERGVEYLTDDGKSVRATKWSTTKQGEFMNYALFVEFANGKTDFTFPSSTVTPEQAIAATLGIDRHPYEQRITGDGSNWAEIMADAFDDLIASAAESCTQDELAALESHIAATLGECEFVIEDNMNETEGMGDVWFRCTNCGMTYDYYADDWLMKQNYCPNCGFKIRKAVKR